MPDTYCKLSSNLPYSSIWQEDAETCKLWITLLSLKDKRGVVTQNMLGVSVLIKIPYEKCMAAIERFCQPDSRSSTPDDDGRRIQKVDDGLLILNHQKYHEAGWSEEKKEFERKRQAAYRARRKLAFKKKAKEQP